MAITWPTTFPETFAGVAAGGAVTAGAVSGVPSSGILRSLSLCAGADAATIIVYTGGNGGTVLCKLGAAAGTSVQRRFAAGVAYVSLYATVTGTSPVYDVEI